MRKAKRIYNTQKEFVKKFKLNNYWFQLKSIYDYDTKEFDFNKVLDDTFDFNSDIIYDYSINDDDIIYSEPKYINNDIDYNAIFESQSGNNFDFRNLISDKLKSKDSFINFYNYIQQNGLNEQFFIEAGLLITDKNGNIIANANKVQNAPSVDKVKEIFSTILKRGGSYTNEAIMQMIAGKKYDDTDTILNQLQNIKIMNIESGMENRFPDAMFNINDNKEEGIPVDFKISYSGKYNSASGSNVSYMTGIYFALLNAIKNNQTLLEFIKNAPLGHYNAGNKTEYDFYKISKNAPVMPELKGFILYSKTEYDKETYRLKYDGFEICPIISSLKNNNGLFSSKNAHGLGNVSYRKPNNYDTYNDKNSILNGLPLEFAKTIKEFYHNISNLDKKSKNNFENFIRVNKANFDDNIEKIVNKIEGVSENDTKNKSRKSKNQKNETSNE